jgi:hypothetical protein
MILNIPGAIFKSHPGRLVGCVAKTRGARDGREASLLFSLGGHSKQAGDEGDLPSNVSFAHPMHLPLAKHVHHLVSL